MSYPISTIGSIGAPACCEPCARGRACASTIGELTPAQFAESILPTIVWPGDVDNYKRRIDPEFRATDAAVSRCAELSSSEAVAWGDFFTNWKKFASTPTPIIGSWQAHLDEAKAFEARLHDWQKQLAATCKLVSPEVVPPKKGGVPWWLIAIGGVVVVGVGYSFYRAGKGAYGRAEAGRRYLEEDVIPRALAGSSSSSSRALART